MSTRTRFEEEANGNSEMAYWSREERTREVHAHVVHPPRLARLSLHEIRDYSRFTTGSIYLWLYF